MATFNDTNYFRIFKGDSTVEKAFDNPSWVREPSISFIYSKISYQRFSQTFTEPGWLRRKIIVLPMVVFGLLKTILYVATAIFTATYYKAHSFYIARELQETFGWLVSLINDRYGQYHIQESDFHKSFYNYYFLRYQFTAIVEDWRFKDFRNEFSNLLKENNVNAARDSLQRLLNTHQKDLLLEEIAKVYLNQKKPKLAKEVTDQISDNRQANKNLLLSDIARTYLCQNQIGFAKQTIDSILDSNRIESINSELTETLIRENRLSEAQEFIQRIRISETRDRLLTKLATVYSKSNNIEMAFKSIKMISNDYKDKGEILENLKNTKTDLFTQAEINEYYFIYTLFLYNKMTYDLENLVGSHRYIAISFSPENQIPKILQAIAVNGFLLRCLKNQGASIFEKIMSQEKAKRFINKVVQDWMEISYINSSSVFINFKRLWLKNTLSSTNFQSLEGSLVFELDKRFNDFLKLAPPTAVFESPFSVLGLSNGASQTAIKVAYRKLVLLFHPDKIKRNSNESLKELAERQKKATEEFQKISDAYHKLVK